MRIKTAGLGLALILGTGALTQLPATAAPAPSDGPTSEPRPANPADALPDPLSDKQNQLRQEAVAEVVSGDAKPQVINGTKVLKVGREPAARSDDGNRQAAAATQDQYVKLSNERTDRVFVLLVQFGNQRHPDFPDQDVDPSTPGPVRFNGPKFNQIPRPGPDDNSTGWLPNYSKSYYQKLYFGEGKNVQSLNTYYETQSSGRYNIKGMVTDVTTVPYNQARYGRPFEGTFEGSSCTLSDIVCSNTWQLLQDGMNQWVADQRAAGKTLTEIRRLLLTYDQQDRYDYDGDGDFNEPDGYLDRFQVVHAGGDQADGDPLYGEDAIWSHRWYSNYPDYGLTGPAVNKAGGFQIGQTGFWVGDYTIQPENGGLSTVAHEYGHDLGLPDEYDSAAGGDNPMNWWSLMAQSRVSAPGDQGLGTRAADLSLWDKLQLGWLDYETVVAGQQRTLQLGPSEYNSPKAQALAMVLPDKQVATTLPTPPEGTKQWWSGAGDDYSASMSRTDLAVPASGGTLSVKVNYNIEEDYDYGYIEVQDPAGSGDWTQLPTSAVDPDTGNDADEAGIDGDSNGWKQASYNLAAYAGKTIGLRFRYVTDGAVQGQTPDRGWSGLLVDDIKLTSGGTTVFADGAEDPPNGWALDGFRSVGAFFTTPYDQFYLAGNRAYISWDYYLKTGPYNFGFGPDQPDKVEHFPYQNGLLVTYWDTSYPDNNTSEHPGSGQNLPVDANPQVLYNLEGEPWRGRIQTYDAPFGLEKSDSFFLNVNGEPSYVRGAPANPLFDDSDPLRYFAPQAAAGLPRVGVKVAGVGVQIRVLEQDGTSMTVRVDKAAPPVG